MEHLKKLYDTILNIISMRYIFFFLLFLVQETTAVAQCEEFWINKETGFQNLPSLNVFTSKSTGWFMDQNFSDEFDGPLNTTKWNTLPQGNCHGMSTHAYFKPENVSTNNGKLILQCVHENTTFNCGSKQMNYSSGWVGTYNRAQYGYFEIKCFMPENPLLQPCFWMFGQIPGRYDEIDVNEYWLDNPIYTNRIRQNIYHRQCSGTCIDTLKSGQLIEANFNQTVTGKEMIFAVEWFPYEINYYINGEVKGSAKYTTDLRLIGPNNCQPTSEFSCIPFDNAISQWIQLSLSLMGVTNNLAPYEVDYIRAYKLKQGDNLYWPAYITINDPKLSKVHTDIKIGGDESHFGWFPSNTQINLWANNSIILDKGTQINPPIQFTARIVKTNAACFLPENQPNIDNE